MRKFLFTVFFLAAPLMAGAGLVPEITVEGRVVSFDDQTVKIYHNGQTTEVPRDRIPQYFKVRSGEHIFAVIESREIKEKISAVQDQASK